MKKIPNVAIAMPYYKTVEGVTALCGIMLGAASAAHCRMAVIECKGCYIEDNRNGAVKHALDTGIDWDYLFWIDGDMQFPADALIRLMAHNKDIVGANYRIRTPPYTSAGHYKRLDDSHLLEPGLWPMDHLPTGLMLVKFEIYRNLAYPWFKPGLWGEIRDDVYFCHYARAAGYEVWCDHDLTREVVHKGEQDLPWFTHEQLRPVVQGAQIDCEAAGKEAEERAKQSKALFDAAAE